MKEFRTLRRIAVAVAQGLDEMRTGSLDRGQAYFHHLYRCLEHACKDPQHDLAWTFPIFGAEDPSASRPRTGWSGAESAALAAYHKEEHLMEQVKKSYAPGGKGGGKDGGMNDQSLEQEVKRRVQEEIKRKKKGDPKGGGKGNDPAGAGGGKGPG